MQADPPPPSLGSALARLRVAEARFRVDPSHVAKQAVVDAAVSLLVEGASTPNIVTLAGEDRADAVEVAAYLDASLRELGLAPLTRDDAACLLMEELAVDLLERRVDAARFADSVLRIADPRLQSLPSGAAGFALDIQYPVSLSEVYGEPPDRVYALAEEYLAWRGRPWSGRPAGRAPSG